ncbi:MAG: hypothetical protein ACD_17C00043G0004 [uncultured bacterium]|nr:MAG: hypothetical protein ACD_17C00043G0004 [uncultured bacterium]OGN56377.1 MAG: hypothetical protein A2796_03035 [Chlamydiae bacterium RIFCSPHIGHO2_01_FULL_44_39]OGN57683.1 MAG: hypothetical protein A3C42_06700 [Chlamydiae bacterium RIFCSPHIGHO2_02_FULL_45_9]OGN60231.1 MAG: hypothetical protein A3D96_05305 [Chlamydiae bacterium RIFCSPHIGHO2_12_FULL_44_59]OGN67116.1 MAG: hypothetical protein A2978_00740 [Chlamydiae bacterium RIFCSPLOWO2_01_FULL_44_52]OGN67706.1 MAG: hypothetical protein A3
MCKKWPLFFVVMFLAILPTPLMGSIIKKPPVKPVETSYHDLECSEQDRANIHIIIATMAEKGKLALLFQQSALREIGAQINHVHPLKFLAVIFKEPYLKSCMSYIWDDYFKRNGFLDGLGPSLFREAEKGKLDLYLEPFAKEIGLQKEDLKPYTDVHDWENLVLYLIQS